jgi:hypothetical protein
MASSLNLLLTSSRKGQFRWNKEARVAFMTLKQAMTTTSVLAMPNFNKSFIIEMEAADEGIGAVLTQQGKLVAFMSHALGVTKKIMVNLRQRNTRMVTIFIGEEVLHPNQPTQPKIFFGTTFGNIEAAKIGIQIDRL